MIWGATRGALMRTIGACFVAMALTFAQSIASRKRNGSNMTHGEGKRWVDHSGGCVGSPSLYAGLGNQHRRWRGQVLRFRRGRGRRLGEGKGPDHSVLGRFAELALRTATAASRPRTAGGVRPVLDTEAQ